MRTLLLGLGLITALVPLAAADSEACDFSTGIAGACAGGGSGGEADCDDYGSYSYGYNEVYVYALVADLWVYGGSICWNDAYGNDREGVVFADSCGIAGCMGAYWYEYDYEYYGSGCNMYVYALVYVPLGCPAGGPPNPGWGNIGFLP